MTTWLLRLSLLLFALAFLDIHRTDPMPVTQDPSKEMGRALYLVLDVSKSMEENILAYKPTGERFQIPKFALMKERTKEFFTGRDHDMIGLVTFARGAQIISPLTRDHQSLLKKLDQLQISQDLNQQGTAIGYALYKTANLIEQTKQWWPAITNAAIILVTDGFQDVNPLDRGRRFRTMEVEEAAAVAKQFDIRVYVINIDPDLNTERYLPYRKQMERITETTGGRFFTTGGAYQLPEIYKAIEEVETILLPEPPQALSVRTLSLYPILIALGMGFLALGLFLRETVVRVTV
ncbi:MAG: VWA domain-containing protein [Chlamydiia bacterium]|nr:VWA domain-containing protein [Chlamydiia bacterium]